MTKTATCDNEVVMSIDTVLTEDEQRAQAEAIEQALAKDDFTLSDYSEVKVRIGWFTTSAKVDDLTAKAMLKESQATRRSVSISKRLLNSKHPLMRACNEAKRDLTNYVGMMSIPKIALTRDSGKKSDDLKARKDAGVRLIRKSLMSEFLSQAEFLTANLMKTVQNLQQGMESVKAKDKEELGKLYDEHDYPSDIAQLVDVEIRFASAQVDADWKELCPEIWEREARLAQAARVEAVKSFVSDFGGSFMKYVKQFTRQLGTRQRLNPQPGCGHDHLLDAELLSVQRSGDDPGVPAGHVMLELRYKPKGKSKNETVWAGPFTEDVLHGELRPYNTTEKRSLNKETIEILKAKLEEAVVKDDAFGPFKPLLAEAVQAVKDQLQRAAGDMNPQYIMERLQKDAKLRSDLEDAMVPLQGVLADAVAVVGKIRRCTEAIEEEEVV